MTIQYIDSQGRKRTGIEKICPVCREKFVTPVYAQGKYCSRKCAGTANRNGKQGKCSGCGKEIWISNSRQKKNKTGYFFCSRDCKDANQHVDGLIKPSHYGKYYRTIYKNNMTCRRCGYQEFEVSVAIHHIDGNRRNNEKDNLIPLCACCHIGLHANKWKLKDLGIV